jgi:dTDP-D-glucose 4,6-dehydratase
MANCISFKGKCFLVTGGGRFFGSHLCESLLSKEGEVIAVDDPKVCCPDIGKARKILGWQPLVSIDDGLKRTFEYFRKEESELESCPHEQNNFMEGHEAKAVRAPMNAHLTHR